MPLPFPQALERDYRITVFSPLVFDFDGPEMSNSLHPTLPAQSTDLPQALNQQCQLIMDLHIQKPSPNMPFPLKLVLPTVVDNCAEHFQSL